MPNTILTPITLWKDFDPSLPFEEEPLFEEQRKICTLRDFTIGGRQTEKGRVRIYMRSYTPPEESYPAVMLLFEAGQPFDESFVYHFLEKGYGVYCVDYCGDNGNERHTVYPEDISYANFVSAGEHLERAEPTARETSWYEWACVARYAARYIAEQKQVTKVGAVGIRAGGEVLFKIAPYAPISCLVSVCAAGWLAYRGTDKFGDEASKSFDEERHRFIAGIDSQSYAPYAKCPVLLLSAVNDKRYFYDRVYDTFQRIAPEVDKAILFSAHGNGLIGTHSLVDVDLFLGKYLKDHMVFLSSPIDVSVGEDENGNLYAEGTFDGEGEILEYGIFYTERSEDSRVCDWTRVLGKELDGNKGKVDFPLFSGSKKVLLYAFANYSNNFSVTSKILEVPLKKKYANMQPCQRTIYSSSDGTNGCSVFRRRARAVAGCFMENAQADVSLKPGYGGILGVTSPSGVISYRVGEARYAPPQGAAFHFDAWSAKGGRLKVIFFLDAEEERGFSDEVWVEPGGRWHSVLLEASAFKLDRADSKGESLEDFSSVVSVVFLPEGEILVNNVLWM